MSGQIIGQKQIAEAFGVTVKTIVEWQDQGFPIESRGSFSGSIENVYSLPACIAWYAKREVEKVRAVSPNDRLANARAEQVEMENAQSRGLLVLASEIEPKLTAAMINAREQWRNEPSRLSVALAGRSAEEIEDALDQAFDAFLHRMAAWRDESSDDEDDEEVAERED